MMLTDNPSTTQPPPPTPLEATKLSKKIKRNPTRYDATRYSSRLIALKLSYLGRNYNGFEHHANNTTPLPTVEEELWAALMKARLISPVAGKGAGRVEELASLWEEVEGRGTPRDVSWEGCEYSKCGRTDKGVSAFGQVIGIRVRSNRPLAKATDGRSPSGELDDSSKEIACPPDTPLPTGTSAEIQETSPPSPPSDPDFDDINDEIPYPHILNRLLPPDIRILAWCPTPPPSFSARFSCRERQYRYFFTQPAYLPPPLPRHPISSQLPAADAANAPQAHSRAVPDGWLDIDAMRAAARSFEGTHDFRNFCKVDGAKQISNFQREVFHADIEEVDAAVTHAGFVFGPAFQPPFLGAPRSARGDGEGGEARPASAKLYTFTLHGSAFLWHQVRHMVATLFLVGQGLEPASLIPTLLDASRTPSRPAYDMAEDWPLVLWDCIFPTDGDPQRQDALRWVYADEAGPGGGVATNGVLENLWRGWRDREVEAAMAGALMGLVATKRLARDAASARPRGAAAGGKDAGRGATGQKIFGGGGAARVVRRYVPVLGRARLETAEESNERYARRKGYGGSREMREALSARRNAGEGA